MLPESIRSAGVIKVGSDVAYAPVEFFDKDGKVVATQRADVGSVAPKQSKTFTVSAEAPGVVAYRYQPVS